MTFFAQQGVLTVPAATGLQTITVGFQPTAIIYWSDGFPAGSGDVAGGTFQVAVQSAAASGDAATANIGMPNNSSSTPGTTGTQYNAAAPNFSPPNVAPANCTLSSVSSTGFVLNWTYVSGISGALVHFLALGGTECLAASKTITARTTTGTQAITGVGFQPKIVIFLYAQAANTGGMGIGAAMSSTARWASSQSIAGSSSMSSTQLASRVQDTTKCISLLTSSGSTTVLAAADLVSLDTDGFTLNWTTATSTTFNLRYLAIGGTGQFAVGSFTKAANTTDTTQTINAGFTTSPRAYMMFGHSATNSTAQTSSIRSIGASDGTNSNSVCAEDRSTVLPSQARSYADSGSGANTVLRQRALPASVSAAGANEVILTHNSFTANGFVLSYTTNAVATAYIYPWIAFGGAPVTEPNNPIAGDSDAFSDTTIDAKWTQWGTGTQTESGGTLNQAMTGVSGQYVGITGLTTYDYTNKCAIAQISAIPSSAIGVQTYLRADLDANNGVIIGYGDNGLFCQHQIGGTITTVYSGAWPSGTIGVRLNFDSVNNRIWYDTYAPGTGWVNCFYEAIPFAITALRTALGSGTYQAVASPGTASWDSIGLAIVVYKNLTGSAAGVATITTLAPTRRRSITGTSNGVSVTTSTLSKGSVKYLTGVAVGQSLGGNYVDRVTVDTPIGWWRLGETSGTAAADSSGRGHGGTYSATGVTLNQTGAIAIGANPAVRLAGSSGASGLVGIPAHADWRPAAGGFWSMEAWINPGALSGTQEIIRIGGADGWFMRLDGGFLTSLWGFTGGQYSQTTGGPIPAANTWTHVVATYDGKFIRHYINGVSKYTIAETRSFSPTNTGALCIGAQDSTNGGEFFLGLLDEVAVYNYALTPGQIASHYAAGMNQYTIIQSIRYKNLTGSSAGVAAVGLTYAKVIPTDGPAGWWRLNEPSGTVVNDSSGNNLSGGYHAAVLGVPGAVAGDSAVDIHTNGGWVQITNSAALDVSGDYTIEMWVQQIIAGRQYLWTKWGGSLANRNLTVQTGADSRPVAQMYAGGSAQTVTATNPIPSTGWHHIAVTRSGSTVTHYLDGAANGTGTISGTGAASGNDLVFGTLPPFGDSTSFCYIDEAAIYGYALSAAQIANHYSSASSAAPTIINTKRLITGSSAGTSTENGQPSRRRSLTGISAGTSTEVGQPSVRRSVTGTSAGKATTTGTILNGIPAGPKDITGTATGVAVTNRATILRRVAIVGSAVGVATASATRVNVRRGVTGSAAGVAVAAGNIYRRKAITGSALGFAILTAAPSAKRSLTGSAAGKATADGFIDTRSSTIKRAQAFGVASTTGQPTRRRPLVAVATSTSTASATISIKKAVTGSSAGKAVTTGVVGRKRNLIGSANGTSATNTASMAKSKQLFGSALGTSVTSIPTLQRVRALTGTAIGKGTTNRALLITMRAITGTANGKAITNGRPINIALILWNGSTFTLAGNHPVVLWDQTEFELRPEEGEIIDYVAYKGSTDQFNPIPTL